MSIQRVLLGDAFGLLRLTLWEGDIGRLEVEKTYRLEDVRVKDFLGEKSLSGAEGWNFEEVEDIGAECVGLEVKGKVEAVEKEIKGAVIMGVGRRLGEVCEVRDGSLPRVMYADGARIGDCCLCHVSQRVLGNLVEVSAELKLVARNGDRVAVDACKDVVKLLTGVQVCDVTRSICCLSRALMARSFTEFCVTQSEMEMRTNQSQRTIAKVDRLRRKGVDLINIYLFELLLYKNLWSVTVALVD